MQLLRSRSSRAMALFLAAGLLPAGPAVAQGTIPVPEAVVQAEAAMLAAWDASPLLLQNAVFIDGSADGFGMFDPRADARFAPGEPIVVYAEPLGYGWEETEPGVFRFGFDIDLLVKSATGKVLGGQDGFGKFRFASRTRNREIMLTLTLTLDDFPPGDYQVTYNVREIAGGKAGAVTLPFTIVE
jgi:hypothetical protein